MTKHNRKLTQSGIIHHLSLLALLFIVGVAIVGTYEIVRSRAAGVVPSDMEKATFAPTFADGPLATQQLGDLATNPVDGTGAVINMNQTAERAADSENCTLTVPANPLSATGLATPWQLGDGCAQKNTTTEGAFVEATILASDGTIKVYNPLVTTAGTAPAVQPTPPTIAQGSAVIVDIGFNGNNLVLVGPGAQQGNCVDAHGQSVIGQVSACNAVNFYDAANAEIAKGTLKVPPVGTSDDNRACETTRNFALIDQDQSDNVVSQYLLNSSGQTAQNTAQNASAMKGSTVISNGSDDALLSEFVDPANGCKPFTALDSTNPAGIAPSQALNELSASQNPRKVIAVIPTNDEMTLVNGGYSIDKTNVYRSLVDQPLLADGTNPALVAMDYCQNMVNIAPTHNKQDWDREVAWRTPVADVGTNLATFMAGRLDASFGNLNCDKFGLKDPADLTTNENGAATGATYDTTQQTASLPSSDPDTQQRTAPGANSHSTPSRRGHHENASGQ